MEEGINVQHKLRSHLSGSVLRYFLVIILLHLFYMYLTLQVPIPEEPDTEDEAELKKWKFKVKAAKKENSERHSERCHVELKLAVRKSLFCKIYLGLMHL